MSRIGRIGLAIVAIVLATSAGASAEPVRTGVNIANVQWVSRAGQDEMLDELRQAGVTLIRSPLTPGAIDFVVRAHRLGIATVAIVPLGYAEGAPRRPVDPNLPGMWPGVGLSHADPAEFERIVGPLLAALEAEGVRLAAIELGNEINWAAFNQDFRLPGRGLVYDEHDLATDPEARRIAEGFDRYVDVLRSLRRLRDGLDVNRRTPILSAGLADVGSAGQRPGVKGDAVSIPATLRRLRAAGLDDVVDAYAVHYYPPAAPGVSAATIARELDEGALAECGGPGRKACWITEWGIAEPQTGCRAEDERRVRGVKRLLEAFAPFEASGRVRARLWFAWATPPGKAPGRWSFAASLCGRLTESGRLAVGAAP